MRTTKDANLRWKVLQMTSRESRSWRNPKENAVASGADLIIGEISAFKDTNWGTFESLEDKGINCYALNGTVVADETMDSIYQDIENMGKIFKVEDKAEALIEDTKAQISENPGCSQRCQRRGQSKASLWTA